MDQAVNCILKFLNLVTQYNEKQEKGKCREQGMQQRSGEQYCLWE